MNDRVTGGQYIGYETMRVCDLPLLEVVVLIAGLIILELYDHCCSRLDDKVHRARGPMGVNVEQPESVNEGEDA